MKKIREEQVRASTDDYEDDKRRQGQKLVSDAKSAIDGGYVLTSSFDHDMAEDLQAQGFNLFKGISNNSLVIGPEDSNDPQSVLDWYDDLTEALKVLRKQYSDADLEEKGIYEGLYNILSAQKEALDDQVAAYRNSADVLKKNKEEVGKYDLSNDLSASKNFRDNPQPLSDSEEAKIDSKIQKTKEYKDAVEEAQETEAKWESGGFNKYGNVDNFNRDKIDWTKENLEKYKDFVAEQNKFNPGEIEEGGYSTVLGAYDNLYRESPEMPLMAYTPMLQTKDGLVPLTEDQVRSYIETIAEKCWTEDDTIDLDKLMKLDATGLERDINGEMIRVKGMIAGVEGGTGSDGKKLTKADIMAISGSSNDEIAQELYGGEMGDYSGMGWLSKYIGRSMHDAQAVAQEGKDNIESIYDSLYDNLAYGNDITTKNELSNDLQSAFDDIAESLGKDSRAMTVSDVVGLTADDVELTDEQAAAINTLTEAATKYKIQGEAWIDVIDKRIDALNEENDAQERAIELAKLQDEYERAKANKTVHVYGGRGQGFVWKADENAVREAGQNLSDKQREYKKKDEIDKLEKLKDKVQETNNLIGTSWDDYQKKLKYTAEFEAMTFEQMEGHYDGFKGSVLNNMQAIQGATNVKNVITDISNLISTLETLANILNLLNGGTGDGGGVFGFINQIKNMFTGENGDFDLGGGFKKMFDGAAKVVSDGWNWITGKNRAGSAALKSDTTATLDILGNTIKVNTGDIQRVSGGFFERLVGAAKDNLGSIGKFFSGA